MLLGFLIILIAIPVLYLIPASKPQDHQEKNYDIQAIAKADFFVSKAPWS